MLDPHITGGGQIRYVANLAGQLQQWGHDVTIGCSENSVLVQRAAEAGARTLSSFQFRGGLRPGAWRNDIAVLNRFLADQTPDIVHVNGSQDHWTAAACRVLLRKRFPLLRTRHNTYVVKNNYFNRRLNRKWTDYQIVVCDVVRRDLSKTPVFSAPHMCTIHNGVDPDLYAPDEALRESIRCSLGYGPGDVVFGIAARLNEAKGHKFLLKAAAQIHHRFPQLRLLVLGQGGLEADLRQLAQDLGIAGIVHFAGFREDMVACTQAMDIGVLPSIDCDTSSFSLKEEMAAQKPVIASNYGGLPEIVSDGVEGYLVRAGEVSPLAAAMVRLLEASVLRERMGIAGRRRVLREFTLEVFAQRTLAAYARAISFYRERTSS
jgi:glycosyltransferase involved in cell wall biosynthesis